ncbi:MAG: DUF1294 domain-containing protein [Patescibacteria group bacterium]|nr:DUF1294 domain-containing protein [Patescibacteria group bacterium]
MSVNYLAFAAWITWNTLAFAFVGLDKRRSVDLGRRLPEVFLFFVAACFAALGVFLGLLFFRHKTRKFYFILGVAILLMQQAWIVYWVFGRT